MNAQENAAMLDRTAGQRHAESVVQRSSRRKRELGRDQNMMPATPRHASAPVTSCHASMPKATRQRICMHVKNAYAACAKMLLLPRCRLSAVCVLPRTACFCFVFMPAVVILLVYGKEGVQCPSHGAQHIQGARRRKCAKRRLGQSMQARARGVGNPAN